MFEFNIDFLTRKAASPAGLAAFYIGVLRAGEYTYYESSMG